MDNGSLLELGLELADLADVLTMERFRARDLHVETKHDATPVTEADRAVERAIRDRLAEVVPDHGVMGEEFGTRLADESDIRWILDPIDGTKSYLRGVPIWATLIAAERAGELVMGVASAPALHTRWWAGRGFGSFRNGEPIRVSSVRHLGDAHLSFAWDSEAAFGEGGLEDRLLALGRNCWRVRALGDFWHHMLVAEGAYDISVDPAAALWDLAAIRVIVEEAGGKATDLAGMPRADGGNVVCTNGLLHEEVLAALAALSVLGPD